MKKKSITNKINKVLKKQIRIMMQTPLKAELYRKLLKEHVEIYKSTELSLSYTSTMSFLYKDEYKLPKVNHVTRTFEKGNMQHLNSFVKISEIKVSECNENIKKSPNLKEIQLFQTTNKLIEKGVLNSFVYCFNKQHSQH